MPLSRKYEISFSLQVRIVSTKAFTISSSTRLCLPNKQQISKIDAEIYCHSYELIAGMVQYYLVTDITEYPP